MKALRRTLAINQPKRKEIAMTTTVASAKTILPRVRKSPRRDFSYTTTKSHRSCGRQPPQSHNQYVALLDRCTTFHQFKQIQASITTSGLHPTPFFTGKLVETLALRLRHHSEALPHAMLLFSHCPHPPNIFTWNTLIRGLALGYAPHRALLLFALMLQTPSVMPDAFGYASALKACARSLACGLTKVIHGLVIVNGNQSNNYVANTALHAYASCGDVSSARKLFNVVPSWDVVGWNAMLAGYVQNGLPDEALKLLLRMRSEGVELTYVTVITALTACARTKDLCLGGQIHGYVGKGTMQFEREVVVGTALIDMYAKSGHSEFARQVFDEMKRRDVGVWNALLGGYVYNGRFAEALRFFEELQASGLRPDEPTLVGALCACGHLGALDVGKTIHSYVEERFPHFDPILGTALIEMYSKCGWIEGSREVFGKMEKKDAMAWTSMIRGLAVHGYAEDALELFSLMRRTGPKPDGVTFVGVLYACSHAGLVEEGLHYFRSMKKDYGITPRVEHYGCMIDLFGRAGRLREAFELVDSMEIHVNAIIWRSLLSACRMNLDVELAEIAVKNLMKLRSDHCGDYVLLSNIYAEKGRWDDARRVREQMKKGQIKKKPAFSLIESNEQLAKGGPLFSKADHYSWIQYKYDRLYPLEQ